MMFGQRRYFKTSGGALLAYRHCNAAPDTARGIIVICHGLAEHGQRYAAFARRLAEAGFHAYAHDHRGHGDTTAPDAPLGRFAHRDGARLVVADTVAMAELAAIEHPGLPLVLFGHSMGGLVALNAAALNPARFQGLAIWNSNFNLGLSGILARWVLRIEKMLKGSDVPSLTMERATFDAWARSIPGATDPRDWLSRDAETVAAYAADPLCGFHPSVSMWMDVVELASRGTRPPALAAISRALPIQLVGGSEDPATHGGADVRWLEERLRRAGFADIAATIYPGMRHETLNEIGRDQAIADFIAWCETRVLPPEGPRGRDRAELSQTE